LFFGHRRHPWTRAAGAWAEIRTVNRLSFPSLAPTWNTRTVQSHAELCTLPRCERLRGTWISAVFQFRHAARQPARENGAATAERSQIQRNITLFVPGTPVAMATAP
jgi:hypothetical protein